MTEKNELGKPVPYRVEGGTPRNQECLRYPGLKCVCYLQDEEKRRKVKRGVRFDLGIYGFGAFSSRNAVEYQRVLEGLCDGGVPPFKERAKKFWRQFWRS